MTQSSDKEDVENGVDCFKNQSTVDYESMPAWTRRQNNNELAARVSFHHHHKGSVFRLPTILKKRYNAFSLNPKNTRECKK